MACCTDKSPHALSEKEVKLRNRCGSAAVKMRKKKKVIVSCQKGYFNAVGLMRTVFDIVSLATGQNTEEQFKSCPSIRLVYHLTAAFFVLESNSP